MDTGTQQSAMRDWGDAPVPLVCDLDGTLIETDITFELCLLHLKANPITGWWFLLFGFLSDKAATKDTLAAVHGNKMSVEHLPYSDVLSHDKLDGYADRALVSGSADAVVREVATRVGDFSHVQGSNATRNLTGAQKAAYLKEVFPQGFDYVGDGKVDIPVWRAARNAFAFNASDATIAAARAEGVELEHLKPRMSEQAALLKAMRPHQ